MSSSTDTSTSPQNKKPHQEPFTGVAPLLGAALLLGTGGGFVLATILTLSRLLNIPAGPWWTSTVQVHGHLQLYGWAGLFVLGIAFYFLPRLRGRPLAAPWLIPWILVAQVSGLLFRTLSQPFMAIAGSDTWRVLLITSGILECAALVGAVVLLGLTERYTPRAPTQKMSPRQGAPQSRTAFRSILPFLIGAFLSLGVASIVNLVNVVQAAYWSGFVLLPGDNLNVTLGLLGFLVPMALAMSAQSLPMYAGLEAFPRRILWPMAGVYLGGLVLFCVGMASGMQPGSWSGIVGGLGMLLVGISLLLFVGIFLRLMRTRGRLPERVARLAPEPEAVARTYKNRVQTERNAFGPFVALIASAYMWAVLGGLLLVADGLALLFGSEPIFALDAIRHSLALGFITLLICGIAPRMVTGFSGGRITSPKLVLATLWLGNIAALLRIGSLLAAPLLTSIQSAGVSLYSIAFGLSGPIGLALSICLLVNLWPALKSAKR